MLGLSFPALLALLALLLPACAPPEPPRPNLLLISLDTLRADHLGCYGYARDTTPSLDRRAAGGSLFEQAMSTSSWTVPAHASLLTGLYPRSHGAIGPGGTLRKTTPTLARLLGEGGYATAAIVNVSSVQRLAVGFDTVDRVPHTGAGTADQVVRKALTWLDELEGGSLFFLFLHFSDVHSDYAPRPAYRRLFDEPYDGIADGRGSQLADVRRGRIQLSPDDARHLVNLYDAGIRQLDADLDRLFRELARRGRLENTVTLVTSDHGEEFLEHGGVLHGHTLHQELVRVPLLLWGPGIPSGLRVREPVSLVDVFPTLAAMAKVPVPEGLEGVDLRRFLEASPSPTSVRALFAETDSWYGQPPGASWRSIRLGSHSFHRDPSTGGAALYDLREDPLEQRDVSREDPDRLEELRELLDRFIETGSAPPAVGVLSEMEKQELRELGYID